MLFCRPLHLHRDWLFENSLKDAVKKACSLKTYYHPFASGILHKLYHTQYTNTDGSEIQLYLRNALNVIYIYNYHPKEDFKSSTIYPLIKEAIISVMNKKDFSISFFGCVASPNNILGDGFYLSDTIFKYGWSEFSVRYDYHATDDTVISTQFPFGAMSEQTLRDISIMISKLPILHKYRSQPIYTIGMVTSNGKEEELYEPDVGLFTVYKKHMTLIVGNMPHAEILMF